MRRSVLVACLGLVAVPLAAQDFNQFCRGNPKLTVGQWSSYHYVGGPADGSTMRLAIVAS
jgi:hypothetical protein